MRSLPLHQTLAAQGALFGERYGVEIVERFEDRSVEYHRIRDTVGLSDFSFMQTFRIPEATGLDFLDALVAGNVARIRFGRILHTFIADDSGKLLADCYIANNDDEFILLCESIVSDEELRAIFEARGAAEAGVQELSSTHVVLSLDGVSAWSVARELFGTEVLGLPYLSIELYAFAGEQLRLFRGGKTSEFGYLLMMSNENAPVLFEQLFAQVGKLGGGLCGSAIHNELRLEGRFFNIYAEGLAVGDPLALGLQWMIDFDKESFGGRDAIFERRAQGLSHKIVGVATAPGNDSLAVGSALYDDGQQVATVVAVCFSDVLNCRIALALFSAELAYTGLEFCLDGPGGAKVATISMPPIIPKSLGVKLDEM